MGVAVDFTTVFDGDFIPVEVCIVTVGVAVDCVVTVGVAVVIVGVAVDCMVMVGVAVKH